MVGLCFFGTESAEAGSLGAHRRERNETEPQSLSASDGGDGEIEALFGATSKEITFIAHCYAQSDIGETEEKPHLFDVVRADRPTLVLIGPEGDFSVEEVRAAQAAGFRSITLGESRLRTETAALVAVQLMNLKKTMG